MSIFVELKRRNVFKVATAYLVVDESGTEQGIAVTQFESADARRAFPCWDEPAYKATFGVTMVVPDQLTALSNSPEESRLDLGDGRVRITFADTMRMSTYLVAFVVGPLDLTEPNEVNGVPIRIAHPRGKGHMTAWAEETAARYLDWLASYYGIPYPADKVDHIAVPDFAFGAMENLGAIVYRETALLLDPALFRDRIPAHQLRLLRIDLLVFIVTMPVPPEFRSVLTASPMTPGCLRHRAALHPNR